MAGSFFLLVYLLIAAMAMGSWGLYIMLVVISNLTFVTSRFLVLRISITAFGMVSYGLLAFASYNVTIADGSGGEITKSYPELAFFCVAGALATGLFFADSVLKTFGDETGEIEDVSPSGEL